MSYRNLDHARGALRKLQVQMKEAERDNDEFMVESFAARIASCERFIEDYQEDEDEWGRPIGRSRGKALIAK
jgi:hypothetical protein